MESDNSSQVNNAEETEPRYSADQSVSKDETQQINGDRLRNTLPSLMDL